MRLHLLVREPTELGLEVAKVIDGASTVSGRDHDVSGLAQLDGDARPGCFDGRDRVDEGWRGGEERRVSWGFHVAAFCGAGRAHFRPCCEGGGH